MDVREFQEKLKEIQETARSQGGSLKAEQIRETFGTAASRRVFSVISQRREFP